jgi:Rho-binding antiterminator
MISCEQHDYIEIVCTFNYPVKLMMKSGKVIEGTALDTQLNEQRQECIKIQQPGIEALVVLDQVAKLEVSITNPHFQSLVF